MNPYFGIDGWSFIGVFFCRLVAMLKGQVGLNELASDEVQLFVLFLIAISCALVGAFLVLKKMTMLANSLSHTILPGLVVAYLLCSLFSGQVEFSISSMSIQTLVLASLVTALMTTFSTQLFSHLFLVNFSISDCEAAGRKVFFETAPREPASMKMSKNSALFILTHNRIAIPPVFLAV